MLTLKLLNLYDYIFAICTLRAHLSKDAINRIINFYINFLQNNRFYTMSMYYIVLRKLHIAYTFQKLSARNVNKR